MVPRPSPQRPWGAVRQWRPRSSRPAPRPSRTTTTSAAPSADTDALRVAWRTAGGAAAAVGVTWTSGLEPTGSGVTSLIRRPVTSEPIGEAGGGLRLGVVRCGRGWVTGRGATVCVAGLGAELVVVAGAGVVGELVVLVVLVGPVVVGPVLAGVVVWPAGGGVERPLAELPDGVAPLWPAGRWLCLPWSEPAGDFDLVGVLPPVCVW